MKFLSFFFYFLVALILLEKQISPLQEKKLSHSHVLDYWALLLGGCTRVTQVRGGQLGSGHRWGRAGVRWGGRLQGGGRARSVGCRSSPPSLLPFPPSHPLLSLLLAPRTPPSFLSSCCLRAGGGTAAPCQLLLPPQPPACMPSSLVLPSLLGHRRFHLTSSSTSFLFFLFFLERDDGRGELVAPLYILKQTRLILIFSSSLFFFFSLVPTRPPPISISGRHAVATHRETRRRGRERQFYGGWKESGSGDGRGGGDASQGQSVIKKRKFIVEEGFFLIVLLCRLGFARCIFFLEREKDNWNSRSARVKGHRVVCCQIVSKPFSFVENISYLHF